MKTAGFANNRPNLNAPITRANQRVLGATTLRRRQLLQEKLSTVKNQLAQWINDLLKFTNPEEADVNRRPLTADNILERLATGVVLCELAIRISPIATMTIPRINNKAKPFSILAHENVKYFINACVSFGVLRHELFEPNSLLNTNPDNRNEREVIFSILSLARVALQKYNIQPPSMVMHENLIDLLDENEVCSPKAEIPDGPDSTGLSRSDDEKIRIAIEDFCRINEIDLATAPVATERRGEYKFGDGTAAHVRMFEAPNLDADSAEGETVSTLLVRYGNTWEDMLTFIGEHAENMNGGIIQARAKLHATSGPMTVSQKLALAKQQRAEEAEMAAKLTAQKAVELAVLQVDPIVIKLDIIPPPEIAPEVIDELRVRAKQADLLKQEAVLTKQLTEDLRAELQAVKNERDAIVKENDAIKTENEAIVKENNAIKVENVAVEATCAAIKAENEAIKAENDALKSESEAVLAENVAIKNEADAVKVENQALNSESLAMKGNVEVQKDEIENSSATISKLNTELEQLRKRLAEMEKDEAERLEREAEDAAAALNVAFEHDDISDNQIELSINEAIKETLDTDDKHTMAIMNTKFDIATMNGLSQRLKNGEKLTTEERRMLNKYNAKKEFFFLTCLAVKMSHRLRDEAQIVDTDQLWEGACKEHVPFHKFVRWISKEITMRVLAKDSSKNDAKNRAAGVSLRSFRTQQAGIAQTRKLTKHDDDEF